MALVMGLELPMVPTEPMKPPKVIQNRISNSKEQYFKNFGLGWGRFLLPINEYESTKINYGIIDKFGAENETRNVSCNPGWYIKMT